MTAGTIGAIGNGLAQPLMALLFGDLIGAFGNALEKNTVSLVSKVSMFESSYICVQCLCLSLC